MPYINVNPWLVVEISTPKGDGISIRAFFLFGAITAPYIAEGHNIRFRGRVSRRGYIKPYYIVNETTGSTWRRWRPFGR